MTLVTRDSVTGLRRSTVRYPEGRPPTPFGCRWCGAQQFHHGQCWSAARGMHRWERPTNAQILARMLARRAARKNVCRCLPPGDVRGLFAPVVNPYRCEADECVMFDQLLGVWLTPLSGSQAAALMDGAS